MTIIAAALDRKNKRIIMAADWQITGAVKLSGEKITRKGQALVGTSGTPLWNRFLRDIDDLVVSPSFTVRRWAEDIADAWWKFATDRGHGSTDSHKWIDGEILIGTTSGLWEISSDGAVIPIDGDFHAIGAGAGIALGVEWYQSHLLTTSSMKSNVMMTVEAACAVHPGCGLMAHKRPFVMELEP